MAGMPIRTLFGMTYDQTLQKIVVAGGSGRPDVWMFDGAAWTRGPALPSAVARRERVRLEYNPAVGGHVLSGGIGPGTVRTDMHLRPAAAARKASRLPSLVRPSSQNSAGWRQPPSPPPRRTTTSRQEAIQMSQVLRALPATLCGGLTVALLAGCASATPAARPEPGGTGPASSTSRIHSVAAPASSPADSPATGNRAVAVYYLADTGATGPRLYREFHARETTPGVIRDAVDAMLHKSPHDRDYRSLWPRSTQVLGVRTSGGQATVDLSREALLGSAGSAYEFASVQQLVWTVTAADPTVNYVRVLIEGKSSGTVGGRDIRDFWGAGGLAYQPLRRQPQVDMLAPVWVLQPVSGARVGPNVTISGTESVFEGVVHWEVRSAGALVRRGSVTGVGAPARGRWSTTVRLAAGSYVVRAFAASPKDGSVTFLDDKSFAVR